MQCLSVVDCGFVWDGWHNKCLVLCVLQSLEGQNRELFEKRVRPIVSNDEPCGNARGFQASLNLYCVHCALNELNVWVVVGGVKDLDAAMAHIPTEDDLNLRSDRANGGARSWPPVRHPVSPHFVPESFPTVAIKEHRIPEIISKSVDTLFFCFYFQQVRESVSHAFPRF